MIAKTSRSAQKTPKRRMGPLEPPKNVKHYVAWLLSRKDYSEKQLLTKLRQRNVPSEEATEAIAFMKEHGFQDDARYASHRAASLSSRLGNRRVAADLHSKGIPEAVIAENLDAVEPEQERAIHVSRKFVGQVFDQALKAKVWRHLTYRGFTSGAIKAALEYLRQQASECSTDLSDFDE